MFNRRKFILSSTLIGGGLVTTNLILKSKTEQLSAPGIITSDKMRPQIPYGVASGDISGGGRAVIRSEETEFLGSQQIEWLKQQLLKSKATWKVIGSDMPVGLVVTDGDTAAENLANGDGVPLGRELEMAELLRFIKEKNIKNVVWLTADVHYAAAHYYDPNLPQFQEFKPFWEFVSGPLNAGTFGPNELDNTFGPVVKYQSVSVEDKVVNLAPTKGLQFFGTVKIDGSTGVMTVKLINIEGKVVYKVDLLPE